MNINLLPTGTFLEEEEVVAVELRNANGTYVKLFNYGTIINKFVVTNIHGEAQDIVLGFDEFDQYLSADYLENYVYLGAAVGRYANRIKNGKFVLNGTDHQLTTNAGNDMLHGGNEGFDKKVWDIVETTDGEQPSVLFEYLSEDGEEGFPGELLVQLRFTLTAHDELILTYYADADEPTPINLTHHSYFNLARATDTIREHMHQINATNWLAQDENYVVTGELVPVNNSAFDFTKPKAIADGWNEELGYDQTYVLDKPYGDLTLATKTSDLDSGLTLAVYTTEPAIHFYTSKYVNVKNGKGGKDYKPFCGFCVETQHAPNSLNIPSFPSTILEVDGAYHQTTIYKVTKA